MYVFRPQQEVGHACSCSSGRVRVNHHNVSRQAAKNQRRTQPKPRRPQALQRRRHMLREMVAAGHIGHRPRIAQEAADVELQGAPQVDENLDDPDIDASLHERNAHDCHRRGGVRARLRARLVHRSVMELADVMERKHGRLWPEHVLRGDFHTFESMRRICEAFCLRPEIERQVLKVTAERARAHQSGEVGAIKLSSSVVKTSSVNEGGLDVDSEASFATFGDFPSSLQATIGFEGKGFVRKFQLQEDSNLVQEIESTSDGGSIAGTLDGASSEVTSIGDFEDDDEDVDDPLVSTPQAGLEERKICHESSDSEATGYEVPNSWSISWKTRVLRVLGLQHRSSIGRGGCDMVASHRKDDSEEDEAEDKEKEEAALSSKLVAAVRNAELHIIRAHSVPTADSQPKLEPRGLERQNESSSRSVHFSKEAEVLFFYDQNFPETTTEFSTSEVPLLEYRRSLHTKFFDGPSGHKAKRTSPSLKGWPSDDEAHTLEHRCTSYASEDVEDEEEWEDLCDDIAELMCQPRSCLLWSSSW